jgi:hypothetical protein
MIEQNAFPAGFAQGLPGTGAREANIVRAADQAPGESAFEHIWLDAMAAPTQSPAGALEANVALVPQPRPWYPWPDEPVKAMVAPVGTGPRKITPEVPGSISAIAAPRGAPDTASKVRLDPADEAGMPQHALSRDAENTRAELDVVIKPRPGMEPLTAGSPMIVLLDPTELNPALKVPDPPDEQGDTRSLPLSVDADPGETGALSAPVPVASQATGSHSDSKPPRPEHGNRQTIGLPDPHRDGPKTAPVLPIIIMPPDPGVLRNVPETNFAMPGHMAIADGLADRTPPPAHTPGSEGHATPSPQQHSSGQRDGRNPAPDLPVGHDSNARHLPAATKTAVAHLRSAPLHVMDQPEPRLSAAIATPEKGTMAILPTLAGAGHAGAPDPQAPQPVAKTAGAPTEIPTERKGQPATNAAPVPHNVAPAASAPRTLPRPAVPSEPGTPVSLPFVPSPHGENASAPVATKPHLTEPQAHPRRTIAPATENRRQSAPDHSAKLQIIDTAPKLAKDQTARDVQRGAGLATPSLASTPGAARFETAPARPHQNAPRDARAVLRMPLIVSPETTVNNLYDTGVGRDRSDLPKLERPFVPQPTAPLKTAGLSANGTDHGDRIPVRDSPSGPPAIADPGPEGRRSAVATLTPSAGILRHEAVVYAPRHDASGKTDFAPTLKQRGRAIGVHATSLATGANSTLIIPSERTAALPRGVLPEPKPLTVPVLPASRDPEAQPNTRSGDGGKSALEARKPGPFADTAPRAVGVARNALTATIPLPRSALAKPGPDLSAAQPISQPSQTNDTPPANPAPVNRDEPGTTRALPTRPDSAGQAAPAPAAPLSAQPSPRHAMVVLSLPVAFPPAVLADLSPHGNRQEPSRPGTSYRPDAPVVLGQPPEPALRPTVEPLASANETSVITPEPARPPTSANALPQAAFTSSLKIDANRGKPQVSQSPAPEKDENPMMERLDGRDRPDATPARQRLPDIVGPTHAATPVPPGISAFADYDAPTPGTGMPHKTSDAGSAPAMIRLPPDPAVKAVATVDPAARADITVGDPGQSGVPSLQASAQGPQAVSGSIPLSPTLPPQADATTLRQIATIVIAAAPGEIELRLSPDELGALRLTLVTDGDAIRVSVEAERQETLDLIRRHVSELAAEFRAMGYGSPSFTFGHSGGGGNAERPAPAITDMEEPDAPATPVPHATDGRHGLDLRI